MSKRVGAIGVLVLLLLTAGVWNLNADSNGASERTETDQTVIAAARLPTARAHRAEEESAAGSDAIQAPDVRGIVVDPSGDAVAGVAVIDSKDTQKYFRVMRWLEPQQLDRAVARTDIDGRFLVADLGVARSLIFVKAGYAPIGFDSAPGMRVVLHPAQTITALVRDTSGRPIAGACVAASGAGLNQRVFTGAAGRVTFDTVPVAAGVRLSGNGLGYFPDMPAQVAPEMTFTLKRMGLIIDTVDAETGEPVAGAHAVFSKHAKPAQLSTAVDPGAIPGFFREQPGQLYRPLYPEPSADGVVLDALQS